MLRILVHSECDAFNATCKCGDRVLSLSTSDIEGPDIILSRDGWVYSIGDGLFLPKTTNADVVARSRCMECKEANEYSMKFRFGVLRSWSELQEPFSTQDIEIGQLEESQ